jgi:hypothetical protein
MLGPRGSYKRSAFVNSRTVRDSESTDQSEISERCARQMSFRRSSVCELL